MRLTVLGSSGGTPSRHNPASGYLIESGSARLWVDAGTGTFMALADRIDPGSLSAVVISHVHVDHCADLFGLYGYLAYGPSGDVPVPVFLPPGAAARLAAFVGATDGHPFTRVLDLVTVSGGESASVGDLTIGFGMAIHSVPALVTRIDDGGGGSLVYSGDTGPGGDLDALLAGADVALIEASLLGSRRPEHTVHHLTAGEAGSAASAAGIGSLIVTHVSPTLDPMVAVAEASASYGGRARLAEPGAVFEV